MSYLEGSNTSKTNFSANGQTLEFDVAASNSVRFEFSGTYTFTTTFESTVDGTNWFPFQVTPTDSSTPVTSHSTANATKAYEASCRAVQKVRAKLTAFTSAGAHKVLIAGDSAR